MRAQPFTRPTIVAANELLAEAIRSHTQINKMVLRLGLEAEIPDDTSLGIEKKCDRLGRTILDRALVPVETLDGRFSLAEAFVREAVSLAEQSSSSIRQRDLLRGLARDGYVVVWGEWRAPPKLRAALPEEVDLPAADDEVRELLKRFGFTVPLRHLDQAIEAHTRGDWEAANAQLRTFLEGLFNDIARSIDPSRAARLQEGINMRQMLADNSIEFLAIDRKEWTADGRSYIEGLFKMLHTDGSHPGLSDEDHCTFRLHVVLVTARTFLRRLQQGRLSSLPPG
ncbi:hypothetical protein EZH22_29860 (plasmid) [Xanthobacter dioxanivorans]|uniref:Uncharacterized protein n=2 Tax=Xanthobacteraceae TaxID=335928 RepID=A0A974SM19_9HYPH|nr:MULTISPECIES: hypothetical protein [Xanthobacteraceae]QRG09954.1 hypothetical protein EZH22_29860 [Xanthobacter dioxanivorans]UOK73474.1 hypothetical protein K9D25_21620 [Ancylobacter polymorphus]